jgi:hypothetical protein
MSTNTQCDVWLASNENWYLSLGDEEEDEDGPQHYGPFGSQESALRYLSKNFANPGAYWVDASGKNPPPKKTFSPNRNLYSSRY